MRPRRMRVAVVQPPSEGRRRLYCSNAHRAEARRRRIAETPELQSGELIDPARSASPPSWTTCVPTRRRSARSIRAPGGGGCQPSSRSDRRGPCRPGGRATAAEETARNAERLATERAAREDNARGTRRSSKSCRPMAAAVRQEAASAPRRAPSMKKPTTRSKEAPRSRAEALQASYARVLLSWRGRNDSRRAQRDVSTRAQFAVSRRRVPRPWPIKRLGRPAG